MSVAGYVGDNMKKCHSMINMNVNRASETSITSDFSSRPTQTSEKFPVGMKTVGSELMAAPTSGECEACVNSLPDNPFFNLPLICL